MEPILGSRFWSVSGKASSPFVTLQKQKITLVTEKYFTGRRRRLPLDNAVQWAALWTYWKPPPRTAQSNPALLAFGDLLVHRNACFFSLVFGLFSLFNVMLKVIWGTYLQNTLFLLMCDMWKNHLQRGWGWKGSAGQDHGHFFFLFLLLPLPVSGLSLISYIVAHLLMCPSLKKNPKQNTEGFFMFFFHCLVSRWLHTKKSKRKLFFNEHPCNSFLMTSFIRRQWHF